MIDSQNWFFAYYRGKLSLKYYVFRTPVKKLIFWSKNSKNGFRVWDVSHFNTVAPRDPISSQDDIKGHYLTHIFGAGLK